MTSMAYVRHYCSNIHISQLVTLTGTFTAEGNSYTTSVNWHMTCHNCYGYGLQAPALAAATAKTSGEPCI